MKTASKSSNLLGSGNAVGGSKPQPTPDVRAAAAFSSRPTLSPRHGLRDRRERLTWPACRALLILLDDERLDRFGALWRGVSQREVKDCVMQSLYARFFVKMVRDGRHRSQPHAVLTEIGSRVARDLRREEDEAKIAPALAGIDAGIEDCPLVYGDQEEEEAL